MPLFMIERHFAERLPRDDDQLRLIEEANTIEGVSWLYSFLTSDRLRLYCVYEAPTAEAIRAAARRAGVPADVVVEVTRVSAEYFPA
ncbi:nickel-binding protein [Flindersiella endophytica]